MPERETGLADGGKLNFEQSFLQFNVQKKFAKSYFKITFSVRPEMLNTRHC